MSEPENNAAIDLKYRFIPIDDTDENLFLKENINAMKKINTTILADREKNTEENIYNQQPKDNTKTLNISSYMRLDTSFTLNDTSFANKIDLAADYQGSFIMYVSDQTFGSAGNIIRTDVPKEKKELWEMENEEGKLL